VSSITPEANLDRAEAGPPPGLPADEVSTDSAVTNDVGMELDSPGHIGDDGLPADSAREDKTIGRLDDIQVHGTTEIQKLKSGAMTVTVIDAKKYAGRFVSIDELLKRAVGVDVRRGGGVGSASRISVRGVGGKALKTFVDGAPLTAVDGLFALDNLPIQLIDRIEIYKGIAPSFLGADCMGGAINVIMIHRETDYIEASYSAGSYNTHTGLLRFRKNWTKPGIALSGGIVPEYADNDYEMDIDWVTDLDKNPVGIQRRNNDAWKWLGGGIGLTFTRLWFDEIEIELEGFFKYKENMAPTLDYPTFDSRTKTLFFPLVSFGLEKENMFVDGLDFEYHGGVIPLAITNHLDTSSYNHQWYARDTTPRPTLTGEIDRWTPHDTQDTLAGTQQRMNISYRFNEHHRINVNDVFQYVKTSPGDSIGDATMQGKTGMEDYTVSGYPARLISNSGAVAWEMTLMQERLVNEVILKVHSIKSQIYGRSWIQMDQVKGVPYQDHNTEHHPGFSEALRFKILPPLLAKASYERAVRLPDQAELFGDGATVLPAVFKDGGLVPEKAHHLNLGFNFTKEDWGGNAPV
jgi:outer membrane receptor protein involved in Fe transport